MHQTLVFPRADNTIRMANNLSYCITHGIKNKLFAKECVENDPEQAWEFNESGQIKQIAEDKCWTIVEKKDAPKLYLRECDSEDSAQVFRFEAKQIKHEWEGNDYCLRTFEENRVRLRKCVTTNF